MKRNISLFVCICMIASCVNAFALTTDGTEANKISEVVILQQEYDSEGNCIYELSQIDGTIYHFEKTEDYVLSISASPTGTYDIAMRYTDDDVIYTDMSQFKNHASSSPLRIVETLRDGVFDNSVTLTCDSLQRYQSHIVPFASDSDYDKVYAALRSMGEPESCYDVWRGSLAPAYFPYVAVLTETISYSVSKTAGPFVAAASTALSVVIAILGWPAGTVMQVATFAALAGGVYGLVASVTFNEYTVYGYGDKYVKINNTYPYRAGYTKTGKAHVGQTAGIADYKVLNKDFDYDDNTALMRKGIDNYILYG